MLIAINKKEAEMLLHSIQELEVTIAEMDGEEEGTSASCSIADLGTLHRPR